MKGRQVKIEKFFFYVTRNPQPKAAYQTTNHQTYILEPAIVRMQWLANAPIVSTDPNESIPARASN